MKQNTNIIINNEQELYVIPAGGGYSCLGFDVVIKKIKALCEELHLPYNDLIRGSIEAYNTYLSVLNIAYEKHTTTGWRSKSELYHPFIGNEGRRVEVEYNNGEKERFYIGKSTGWVPCHIMIKQSNSSGGGAVLVDFIKSFKFIDKRIY